ncbi:hypothetical protein [Nocardia sp. NRRL S-836]|uniref:hypothetical protein n=1 Tax=Nocardia sp. NRRL S-836 TaxID=1519492 RepID=UPI000A78EC55|nr:hypothetical protein [Nocardia sp. NRRL S-836]
MIKKLAAAVAATAVLALAFVPAAAGSQDCGIPQANPGCADPGSVAQVLPQDR